MNRIHHVLKKLVNVSVLVFKLHYIQLVYIKYILFMLIFVRKSSGRKASDKLMVTSLFTQLHTLMDFIISADCNVTKKKK